MLKLSFYMTVKYGSKVEFFVVNRRFKDDSKPKILNDLRPSVLEETGQKQL